MVAEYIRGVRDEHLCPEYWLDRLPSDSHGSGDRDACNQALACFSEGLTDLTALLAAPVLDRPIPPVQRDARTLFDETGEPLGDRFWAEVEDNASASVLACIPGVAVRQTDLRRFPTAAKAFRTPEDRVDDQFQDTTLHTFEPLLSFGLSRDREWRYVISRTYAGWVRDHDVADMTQAEFERWAHPQHVLVVADTGVATQPNPYHPAVSNKAVEFAAVLPLWDAEREFGSIHVAWPCRSEAGTLTPMMASIRDNGRTQVGYLPFTRESIVRVAFRLLGERYGWGGAFGMHDCSSFVMDVYRTVGVQLPRDAAMQEVALPNRIVIPQKASITARMDILAGLSAGDLLFMPGHVMMYLGAEGGKHYVIHGFAGYVDRVNGRARYVSVDAVMVSPLEIETRTGMTFLESLTGALDPFAGRLWEG